MYLDLIHKDVFVVVAVAVAVFCFFCFFIPQLLLRGLPESWMSFYVCSHFPAICSNSCMLMLQVWNEVMLRILLLAKSSFEEKVLALCALWC